MKIAILGANGFIGSRLTEQLYLTRYAEVRPIVRSFPGLAALSRFNLDNRIADGFDQKSLYEAFKGCDVVVNCIAGDTQTILNTLQPIYSAAHQARVERLVYLSSAMVHGQMPVPGTDESSSLDRRQAIPYNNAKVRAEKMLLKLRRKGKVEVVILRPGIVYGPRSIWVTRFISEFLGGTAYLINKGRGICNSIYIDNLIHAIRLAMSEEEIDQQAFLIRDAELITWADLYQPITDYFGYDVKEITNIEPPFYVTEENDLFDRVTNNKIIKSIVSPIPKKYRLSLYSTASQLMKPEDDSASLWSIPKKSRPSVDLERLLLYQCEYALPWKKAYKYLNYEPEVPFTEAIRRTLAWMQYAGYTPLKKKAEQLNLYSAAQK